VSAIDADDEGIIARCRDGGLFEASAAILTVPLPLLPGIALPPIAAAKVAAACGDIGFGNVVKILLRFATSWWQDCGERGLADLSFLISSAKVPTWWTQHPALHPVLTGWLAGPRAAAVVGLGAAELVELGLDSLAEMFAVSTDRLRQMLIAARAVNWGNDPFARGAYSYATPKTPDAQSVLREPEAGIFFSGEALYAGAEMGTVEAALVSGSETARTILSRRG
jgi:monoamine oxidase